MEGLVSLGGLWKSEGIYRNAIIINRHCFYVPTHVLPREANAPAPIQGARKRQQILRGIERSVSSSVYPSVRASVYLSISPSFRPSVRQSVSIRLFTDIFRQANDYMALFLPTVPYRFLSSFFFVLKFAEVLTLWWEYLLCTSDILNLTEDVKDRTEQERTS